MQFYYGQRVRCIDVADGNGSVVGQIGTVRDFTTSYDAEDELWPGVEFDEEIENGHSLDDAETGETIAWDHGWYCPPKTLILLDIPIGVDELI